MPLQNVKAPFHFEKDYSILKDRLNINVSSI